MEQVHAYVATTHSCHDSWVFNALFPPSKVLTELATGRAHILRTPRHYGTLEPGNTYSNTITYVIPSALPTGVYNLTAHADYTNSVFELNADGNNIRWREIRIEERLSDLFVSELFLTVQTTPRGNQIQMNYTVLNQGQGPTVMTSWADRISISFQQVYSVQESTFLQQYIHRDGLLPEESRTVSLLTRISQTLIGTIYLHVQIDYNGRITEENENNNVRTSGPVTLPPVFPDLSVESLTSNATTDTPTGDSIELQWVVINVGNGEIANRRWIDSVYLESSSQITSRSIKLADISLSLSLQPSGRYNGSVIVQLPVGVTGDYNLILNVNDNQAIDENRRVENSNNLAIQPIYLFTPPTPDFRVTLVKFTYYDFNRILTVEWRVQNTGNSLRGNTSWMDQVFLSTGSTFNRQQALGIGEAAVSVVPLESQQQYFTSSSFILPFTIEGNYHIFVETDSRNNVMEINGENSNIRRSEDTVSVSPPPIPRLRIEINEVILPTSTTAGQTLTIEYTVSNVGNSRLNLASWLDGIYLTASNNIDRSLVFEEGILLTQILNNREINKNEIYTTSVNVTVPHGVNQPLYLTVIVDVNDNLEELAADRNGQHLLVSTTSPILIKQGPLSDLSVMISIATLNLQGGQPATVSYQVLNRGENRAIGTWYEAIYLSSDAALDPFDFKLKTVRNRMELGVNESYIQNVEIFIPFDLPTANYYLFFEIDGVNRIAEFNTSNNVDFQVVTITESVSTDLTVTDVTASPTALDYGDGKCKQTQKSTGLTLAIGLSYLQM